MASAARTMRRALVTPEGIDLGVTLADFGARFGALLVDLVIQLVTLVALTIAAFTLLRGESGFEVALILWLLGFFLLRNGYFLLLELRPRAATFGKQMVGLRVVARDGGRLTADAVVARNLLREIELFLPLTLLFAPDIGWTTKGLGLVWALVFALFPLFNRDRLRVGDLLAGTWVIRARRDRLKADLAAAPPRTAIAFTPAQLDAYGVYELETLEGVLRTGGREDRLVVARAIVARIGWPHDVADVDAFLHAYYTGLRARLEGGLLQGRRRENKYAGVD